jgi:uncharacterized protein (DUF2141 family)
MRLTFALLAGSLLGAAAWASGTSVTLASSEPHPAPITVPATDVIDVEVLGLRNENGQLSCVLYDNADAFPTHPEHAIGGQRVDIHGVTGHCRFENVPPGVYAVAVHHDENNNHHLDTNFLGLPREGYGMSRDAKPHLAPPRFQDAKFDFAGGVLHVTLHMQY